MGAIGMKAAPFRCHVPDEFLEDLSRRLAHVRWPTAPDGAPWQYGAEPAFMRRLLAYWQNGFDWRRWEDRLNAHEQYLVQDGDLSLHALIARADNPAALPLLLTHGWPGSIIELLDVIEPLTHPERFGGKPEDAFTVVLPSLPGYGFSTAPRRPMSPRELAPVWHRLMTEAFGFARYGAHGGDWGALVTGWLGFDAPPGLVAIHQTSSSPMARWTFDGTPPSDEEQDYFARTQQKTARETGYQAIQGTKPLTLSYALTDSPMGLAAWVAEKFHGWTDREGGDDPLIGLDSLIANIMMHWIPGPGPATWMYAYLLDGSAMTLPEGGRIEVPTGICSFPQDFGPVPPESLLRRSFNLTHRTIASGGGHFPGLERSEELAGDIRTYFSRYR
jgi:microsomal epoxide hydrolase